MSGSCAEARCDASAAAPGSVISVVMFVFFSNAHFLPLFGAPLPRALTKRSLLQRKREGEGGGRREGTGGGETDAAKCLVARAERAQPELRGFAETPAAFFVCLFVRSFVYCVRLCLCSLFILCLVYLCVFLNSKKHV